MTIHFNADAAMKSIETVVAGKLATVSRGTDSYVRRGDAVGIVGQALKRSGVTIAQLQAMADQPTNDIGVVKLPAGVTMTNHARRIFQAVQIAERSHRTWDEAHRRARAAHAWLA